MTAASYAPPDPAQILAARRWLADQDPVLAAADAATPAFDWRVRPAGFAALAQLIAEQQVSVASARAIWRRVETGLSQVTPETVRAAGLERLRSFGLSGPKARYIGGMAEAVIEGEIDFEALRTMDDLSASDALQRLTGVGRWTAETYLLFSEGRLDFLPAGDVALQQAVAMAAGLDRRPSQPELYARAEMWRPYRGVAAHLLWRFYGGIKRGEIALPTR